ncbi:hypothetical protein GCM10027347_17490 [Larkinella harenae]
MNKKTLQDLINTHRAQMEYCKRVLDNHYYDLEERDEETKWINRYLKHKQILEWLESQTPDE